MRGGTGDAVGMSSSTVFVDARGRRRSPATLPGHHTGRPPRNKGRRYPADPPTVEEIVRWRRSLRTRALIVLLWRAGLRISEALAESDLDCERGGVLVRRGKGDKRREVGMDAWAGITSIDGSRRAWTCRSARCCA
jgi:integrase